MSNVIDLSSTNSKIILNYNSYTPIDLTFYESRNPDVLKDLTDYTVYISISDKDTFKELLKKDFSIDTPLSGQASVVLDGSDWDNLKSGSFVFNIGIKHLSWLSSSPRISGECSIVLQSQ